MKREQEGESVCQTELHSSTTEHDAEEWFMQLLSRVRKGKRKRVLKTEDQRELLCHCRHFGWRVDERTAALLEAGAKFSSLIDDLLYGRVSGYMWPVLVPYWEREQTRLDEKELIKQLRSGTDLWDDWEKRSMHLEVLRFPDETEIPDEWLVGAASLGEVSCQR